MQNSENSCCKYNLVVCEIHNEYLHGYNSDSDPNIKGHYLCSYVLRNCFFFNNNTTTVEDEDEDPHIYEMVEVYKNLYSNLNVFTDHAFIRNYKKIVSNKQYIVPHIAEVIYLSGQESCAIIKTMWLKVVQRRWKKVFRERNRILNIRKQTQSLLYRERYGKWPIICAHIPSVRGMLSDLF